MKVHTLGFNKEAIKWLGVYFNTDVQFRAHKNMSFEKARKVVDRFCWLRSTNGLEPDLIRNIQVAAVQAVTLYGAEL